MDNSTAVLHHVQTPLGPLPPPPILLSPTSFMDGMPTVFVPSVLSLLSAYRMAATLYPIRKQRAWILTGMSSAFMTIVSLPFFWDWISGNRNMLSFGVAQEGVLAYAGSRFFQAYLIA